MRGIAIVVFITGFGVAAAQAAPLAPAHPAGPTPIIKVIEGCGPHGHRGPGGACRPRHNCPRGWHSGPQGWHCYRNH